MNYKVTREEVELYAVILDYFKDHDATLRWFNTKNPLLKGRTPNECLKDGEAKKIGKMVGASQET